MRPFLLLVLFLSSLTIHAHADSVNYSVAIDTSTLAGTTGSLDFNFEPGPFGSSQATVQIRRFAGDGSPSGNPTLSGDAGGSLLGNLQFTNGTGYNDYFQAYTFDSLLSFDIMLDGPAIGSANPGSSGSTFAFSIFSDTDGTMPALTSNTVDGYAITVDINADGSTTLRNYTQSPINVTPELPTGTLVATATIVAAVFRRKRSQTQIIAAEPMLVCGGRTS